MSTLKALRTRIKSVKATQKITTAMKLVSAAKLRRAQEQLESYKSYAQTLDHAWQSALSGCDKDDLPKWLLPETSTEASELVVVFMADRGLCGSYNAVITRYIRHMMMTAKSQNRTIKILPLGFKAIDLLRGEFQSSFLKILFENREKKPTLSQILHTTGDFLVEHLKENQYSSVKLVFTEFRSILRQDVTQCELLIGGSETDSPGSDIAGGYGPLLEPNAGELINNLAAMYVTSRIRYALYQSQTSEQAARMRAMDAATDNANDIITKLNRTYNRTRQAGITRELIEIISGANALAN